ncbi:MAG: glycosyltransferase [Pseudomonadota bacterium]
MLISVIIATHNGAATLPRMLDALAAVDQPPGGPGGSVEVIAVDNASNDTTAAILDTATRTLPMPLRRIAEPRRGKCSALNTGLDAALGDLIVFADDDILPDPGWLQAYARAAAAFTDVALFAGQVRHSWDRPPPGWLAELASRGHAWAGTDITRPAGPIDWTQVKGLNMAVRRRALGTVRFAERPGLNFSGQGASVGGEDTLFAREITASGQAARYVPDACVRHIVRAEQIGVRPLLQRYYRIGRAQIVSDPTLAAGPRLAGMARAPLVYAARRTLGALLRLVRGQTAAAAERLVDAAMALGRAREAGRHATSRQGAQP